MEAFFLSSGDGAAGARFCICHRPAGTPRGGVLYLHPFAEEMNKARRMAALQARAMAGAGFTVLLMDLQGCGDSGSDFAQASWADWVRETMQGLAWLRSQTAGPVWAWGLRAGCLLAAEAARRDGGPDHLLFWQPPASGKVLLQQFLRLRAALEALDGGSKGVVEGLRRQLAAGQAVEVAGYCLPAGIAQGMEQATMAAPTGRGRMHLIEIGARADSDALTPAARRTLEHWQQAGWTSAANSVEGPAFWQTTEVETAAAIIPPSLAALRGAVA